ncbi:MAG: precorrin-3B synthase [Acetobacteraceae bacterium]|nr:precorrin-3B synthase [Acetobacteraceae bacterium]
MRRGWCPSLFAPMPSGDGLLVRLKPPGARMTVSAARALAGAAARFGDGSIALTRRAATQVRGLRARDAPAFAAAMIEAGLADPDPEVERRRAVIVAPLNRDDPDASPDAPLVAAVIENRLTRDPRFALLPAKFCVSVDGGGVLPLGDVGADIRVACAGGACSVAVGEWAAEGDAADAVEWVARLALAFLDLSARVSPPPRRMRDLVEALGTFPSVIAGLDPAIQPKFHALGTPPWMRGSSGRMATKCSAVGWLSYASADHGAFGLGLPLGATDAGCLARMADLAQRFGAGALCLTPWRALVIPGVSARDAAALREAGAALGVIVDDADPRLKVSACVGRPGCARASVDARADAAALAWPGLRATVHVSGCAKRCAHPGAADVTLVGEEGRYALVRDGALPVRGLTLTQAAALIEGAAP